MKSLSTYAALAVAAVSALIGGSALYIYVQRSASGGDVFAECRSGQVAGGEIGGPFTLVNGAGETVTDKDVLQKPSLVYFGYGSCPDVCPVDNARNSDAADILEEMGYDVTPVFITVDPARDTPEFMADYAQNMNPKMIALTGSEEQVKAASKAYKTYYRKQDGDDEYYLVDHTTFTYLMLPQTGFADFFDREVTPDQMADRVACYLNKI